MVSSESSLGILKCLMGLVELDPIREMSHRATEWKDTATNRKCPKKGIDSRPETVGGKALALRVALPRRSRLYGPQSSRIKKGMKGEALNEWCTDGEMKADPTVAAGRRILGAALFVVASRFLKAAPAVRSRLRALCVRPTLSSCIADGILLFKIHLLRDRRL